MKTYVCAYLILALFVTTAYAGDVDGVMSVTSKRGELSVFGYAKWKLPANAFMAEEIYAPFAGFHQRDEADGSAVFLVPDDAVLAQVKAVLDLYNVKYPMGEINVELTIDEKAVLEASSIKSRGEVTPLLKRAAAIRSAGTLGELKDELVKGISVTGP